MKTRVTRVEDSVRFTEAGLTERVLRVTFRVGEQGPFTIDFRAAEFSAATVTERLEQFAREI